AGAAAGAGEERDRRGHRSQPGQHRRRGARARHQPLDAVLPLAQARARAPLADPAERARAGAARGVAMRLLVVMDSPGTINPRTDTTLVIIDEARRRGHSVEICLPRHLELFDGRLRGSFGAVTHSSGALGVAA